MKKAYEELAEQIQEKIDFYRREYANPNADGRQVDRGVAGFLSGYFGSDLTQFLEATINRINEEKDDDYTKR